MRREMKKKEQKLRGNRNNRHSRRKAIQTHKIKPSPPWPSERSEEVCPGLQRRWRDQRWP
jgi:hypothetical protein